MHSSWVRVLTTLMVWTKTTKLARPLLTRAISLAEMIGIQMMRGYSTSRVVYGGNEWKMSMESL